VSGFFQSEKEELKKILDLVTNFVISNNKSIRFTQYYISLGNKNFLQIVEDTFNDPILDEKQKNEHVELMKTFLEKLKNLYFRLSLLDHPETLEMKNGIEEAVKFFGFAGNGVDDLFSELENTLNRLDKKEVLL
jgi:hypothetical protein